MLLIGSGALSIRAPSLAEGRTIQDTDLMGSWDEFKCVQIHSGAKASIPNPTGTKIVIRQAVVARRPIEFEFSWPGSTCESLIKLVEADPETELWPVWYGQVHVPSLDVLFTIKSSHRFVSGKHFNKTMKDWHLLRNAGASIPTAYTEWLKARQTEVQQRKHPKLNTSRAQFFNPDEGVRYIYDHDSIHRAVANLDRPAYTFFQKPGSEVMCDKTLFFAAPLEVQLYSVVEEAYVLAVERSHVPHGTLSAKEAFNIALEKVCTTISSGWWRDFAYENYYKVQAIYRDDYLTRFKAALSRGEIPPFKS